MQHRPTYSDLGAWHYVTCHCGWRSSLAPDQSTCERAFREHKHMEESP